MHLDCKSGRINLIIVNTREILVTEKFLVPNAENVICNQTNSSLAKDFYSSKDNV
jgi:hypothetical protein